MNQMNDFDTRQQARAWSAQLGELSGGLPPTSQPQPPLLPTNNATPSRFSAAIARLLRGRTPAQDHAERKLMANEFMSG
jgi:hypothetical protein